MAVEQKVSFGQLREARGLFERGTSGKSLFRQALQYRTPEELREMRENFGQGVAGKIAFAMVASGAKCEARTGENGKECSELSQGTLDFDVMGYLDTVPVCGNECTVFEKGMIDSELAAQGRSTVFGINGKGRA